MSTHVYPESGELCIYLATGPGTFAPCRSIDRNVRQIAAAHLDADPHIDLAMNTGPDNGLAILWGKGDGTFEDGETVVPNQAFTALVMLLTADFDGDDDADVLINHAAFDTTLALFANGDRTFEQEGSEVGLGQGVQVAADFNSDGNQDILFTTQTDRAMTMALGNGLGSFTVARTCQNCSYGTVLKVADFDGDGHPDVVTVHGELTVSLGDGLGWFLSQSETYRAGGTSIEVGEFNGDGIVDLVTVEKSSDEVLVLLGVGNGLFQPSPAISLRPEGRGPVAVVAADFNGDGLDDVATLNETTSNLSVLLSAP